VTEYFFVKNKSGKFHDDDNDDDHVNARLVSLAVSSHRIPTTRAIIGMTVVDINCRTMW